MEVWNDQFRKKLSQTKGDQKSSRPPVYCMLADLIFRKSFSEDPCHTLSAVDGAFTGSTPPPKVWGDRGADPQALRGVPAARRADPTFVNKLDRERPDPFAFTDEIGKSLALAFR